MGRGGEWQWVRYLGIGIFSSKNTIFLSKSPQKHHFYTNITSKTPISHQKTPQNPPKHLKNTSKTPFSHQKHPKSPQKHRFPIIPGTPPPSMPPPTTPAPPPTFSLY
jgi:hypothetical protein